MAARRYPNCTLCGSEDVLPFEDDEPAKEDTTLFIILLALVLIFVGYLLFLFSTFVLFPLAVFSGIIFITRTINKYFADKKNTTVDKVRDYVCMDCGGFFKS